ncbi:hypothetical protein ACOACO_04680 [Nocardioides sp. CPCC 205120]|uniref:hypothetical protein n=1 Tax=Nocardioides sp. CPCC 205120 TaxID=3406462 RepID=UPI003B503C54
MSAPGPNEQQLIQALRARRAVLEDQRNGWRTGSQMAADAAHALRAARVRLDAEEQLGEASRNKMIAALEGIDVQFKRLAENMRIGVDALHTADGSVTTAHAAYLPIAGASIPSSPTQSPYDPEWDQAQRTEADRQHSAAVASHQQALQERENKCAQILAGLRGGMGESQVLWSQINDYHSDDQGRGPSDGPSSPTPGAVSSPGAGRNSAGVIDRARWGEVVADPPRVDFHPVRPDDGDDHVIIGDGDDVDNGSLVPNPHPPITGTPVPGVLPSPSPGDTGLLGRGPDGAGGPGMPISGGAGGGGGGLGAVAPAAGVAGGALGAAAVRGGAGLVSAGGAGGAGAGGRAIGATSRAAGPGALGGRGGAMVAGGGGGAAGRGGAAGAGGRGAGAVGSRGGRGGMSGATGAAGGAGGRGGRSGRQNAEDRDHLLIDEDWIDDEATGPDVLR